MCHIPDRLDVLREWHRVLRPGGRILFTDGMVLTGMVAHVELALRSFIGFYIFLPPGENERLIVEAGLSVVLTEDLTAAAESIAQRWHDARERHRDQLVAREANVSGLQRFLAGVRRLSAGATATSARRPTRVEEDEHGAVRSLRLHAP